MGYRLCTQGSPTPCACFMRHGDEIALGHLCRPLDVGCLAAAETVTQCRQVDLHEGLTTSERSCSQLVALQKSRPGCSRSSGHPGYCVGLLVALLRPAVGWPCTRRRA